MSHSQTPIFISKDCRYPGCKKAQQTRGFCRGHYEQTLRNKRNLRNQTSDGVKPEIGCSKLTESQVKEVLKLKSKFVTQREIAKQFGVSLTVVKKIFDKTYSPAPDPAEV